MLPRIAVIANRLAHNLAGTREGPLEEIRSAVSRAGAARASLHETASLDDLGAAVEEIRARGTDCVVLAGGDGSYMAGTTALSRPDAFGDALPFLAFVPGGTVCTVARNWGFHGKPRVYTQRILDQILHGTAMVASRPTLRVRDDRGGDRVGFIFGAGLVARFFDAYYETKEPGSLAAAGLVARIFAGTFTSGELAQRVLTPGPARIVVDGREQGPRAWSLIAASVVKDLGLHMHLLHRAGESKAAFHFVASPLPPRDLSPQVGRVLLGRPLRGEGHVDTLAREVTLTLGDAGARSTYVLDGDRIEGSSVTLTAGPVLRYLSPSPLS